MRNLKSSFMHLPRLRIIYLAFAIAILLPLLAPAGVADAYWRQTRTFTVHDFGPGGVVVQEAQVSITVNHSDVDQLCQALMRIDSRPGVVSKPGKINITVTRLDLLRDGVIVERLQNGYYHLSNVYWSEPPAVSYRYGTREVHQFQAQATFGIRFQSGDLYSGTTSSYIDTNKCAWV
jgi:hypothetical protein